MSDSKRNTLATLGPTWLVEPASVLGSVGSDSGSQSEGLASRLDEVFGRAAPRMLDIGVGTGEATVAWAVAHPDHDVMAVELHLPGIARLLAAGHAAGLANVRVLEADVTRLLDLAPGGPDDAAPFTQVRVLFPDPWPKKRHVRRRLVDGNFIGQITDLLAVGGTLHLATDWPPYADQMRAVIATEPRLEPQVDEVDPVEVADVVDVVDETEPEPEGGAPAGAVRWRSQRPERPVTAYEQRGLDAGRPITDLMARRSR